MHLIIVEDLETDREQLAGLIRQDCARTGRTVDLSFYESGEAFLEQYHPGSCDGIFLDILMNTLSGVDVAWKVREAEPRLPIIFTTTEPDYALDGFSLHALDYLVKPVTAEKVAWCLKELTAYLETPASLSLTEISGRGHSKPLDIPLDNIRYAEYHRHVMEIHTALGKFTARISFQDFTAKLPHNGRFYVCGRGLVVNFSQIERVEDGFLLLKGGEILPFSHRRKKEVQKAFRDWTFASLRKGGWT